MTKVKNQIAKDSLAPKAKKLEFELIKQDKDSGVAWGRCARASMCCQSAAGKSWIRPSQLVRREVDHADLELNKWACNSSKSMKTTTTIIIHQSKITSTNLMVYLIWYHAGCHAQDPTHEQASCMRIEPGIACCWKLLLPIENSIPGITEYCDKIWSLVWIQSWQVEVGAVHARG